MTLFGCPSRDFDGVNDIASLPSPSWLNGLTAYTLLLDLMHGRTTDESGFFRIGGTATGSDDACWLSVRQAPTSAFASPAITNFYYSVQHTLIAAVDTTCRIEGEGGRILAGVPSCFAVAWSSGTAQQMVSAARAETEAYRAIATPTGTQITTTGLLAFAAGPRAYWFGRLGLCRIAKTKRSDAWIESEQSNRLDYRGLVASGAMFGPGAVAACIAYPVSANLPTGATVLTPLDSATGVGLQIVTAIPSTGTAVINAAGTTITYTPPTPAPEAAVTVGFAIEDAGGRRSSSRIYLAATPSLSISANAASVNEGDTGSTPIGFTVHRSGDLGFASSCSWSVDLTVANSVVASDFAAGTIPSGTVSWIAGETADKAIGCSMQGDIIDEGNKTLRVQLSTPVNCRLGPSSGAQTILVDDDGVEPPEPELSTPLRTIEVATAVELTGVLAATTGTFAAAIEVVGPDRNAPVRAGDHILCSPGTYNGKFTLSRAGTETDPIVITRRDTSGTVTLSGDVELTGVWCGLHRLRFTGNAVASVNNRLAVVNLAATGARLTRCLFDGCSGGTSNGSIVFLSGGGHPLVRIDHNEFRNVTAFVISDNVEDISQHQHCRIDHNYFNGHTGSGTSESVILARMDAFHDSIWSIDSNLFSNCLQGSPTELELISCRVSAVTIRNNSFLNCHGGYIALRNASRCAVDDNWLRNGAYIEVFGDDHFIRNNNSDAIVAKAPRGNCTMATTTPTECATYVDNGSAPIVQKNSPPTAAGCGIGYAAGRRLRFQDNIGTIEIGRQDAGTPTHNVNLSDAITLTNNAVAATILNQSVPPVVETGIGGNTTTAVALTAADVGPES